MNKRKKYSMYYYSLTSVPSIPVSWV